MMPDVCPEHHDVMKRIEEKLDSIIERLSRGDVTFATTVLRLDQIEKVVYGAMGLALTAVAGALLSLVIKVR
jgi:hypothetical protein